LKALRERLSKLGGNSSIEANLKLLGIAGLALFVTLVASLFYVQHGLLSSQERLTEVTLPIRRALGRLDAAVGNAFRREAQLSSARDATQLKALVDRSAIERELQDAMRQLRELWPRAVETGADRGAMDKLDASVKAFLDSDSELSAAIERRHALQARFDVQLGAVDKDLRALIEGAQSISGVLRLDFIVALRRIHQGVQYNGSAPASLIKQITVGTTRAALDSMAELVDAVLALGVLVGKTGLASSRDSLTAVAANELAQNHTQITRVLGVLQLHLQGSPALERLTELEKQYDSLSARIVDEKQMDSLLQLRRQVLEEAARAVESHELGIARAGELTGSVEQLRAAATTLATEATADAMRSANRGRVFSALVAVSGVLVCLFAALRIRQSVSSLQTHNRELQNLKDNLEHVNQNLEGIVSERTAAMLQRERALQLVLDSMSDGMISAGLDGALRPERSKTVVEWFGEPNARVKVWDYLYPVDERCASAFRVGFDQLVAGDLPFELCRDQMPRAIERDQRSFALDYQPMREAEKVVSVVIAIRDVTLQIEVERAERIAREQQRTISFLLKDKRGFARMARECEGLVTQVIGSDDVVLRRRALHTLKGNSAIFGLITVSERAHELETKLDEQGELSENDGEQLRALWHDSMVRLEEFVAHAHDTYEIAETDLEPVLTALRHRVDYQDILRMVEAFRLEPAGAALRRLGAQARRLAQEHGKSMHVQVVDNSIRLSPESFQALFSAFVHAIRNAIDHGVETPEERLAAGKPEIATLALRVGQLPDQQLVFEIADDGRGINWDRVREKARARGLPADTSEELQELIWSDGFSTRDEVSALSGRGVGMSALRAVCQEMGGSVGLHSTAGLGTTIRCVVSIPQLQRMPSRRPSIRSSIRVSRA
jgi:HPt (histidine-containing phosphotransfer) domain-containing protein/two-component sensor histidine kinase